MFKPYKIDGKWWVSGKPKPKVTGTLSIDDDERISLSLVDCLEKRPLFSNRLPERQVILGLTTDGERITLVDCFEVSYRTTSSGIPTSKYIADFVLKGQHFRTLDDVKTKKVLARFSYLDTWLSLDGFRIDHTKSDERDLEIRYKRPSNQTIKVNDKTSLITGTGVSGPNLRSFVTEVHVKQEAYLGIEKSSPVSLKSILKELGRAKDLISLATQNPAAYSRVLIWPERTGYRTYLGRSSDEVEIFFRQVHPRVSEEDIGRRSMLFTFKDVQEDGQDARLVRRWFDLASTIGPALDLYFAAIADPGMYLQQKFLILSQALESYSRLMGDNTVLTKKEHKERLAKIIGRVLPEHEPWLKKRLENSNEPSFLMRIKNISASVKEPAEIVVKNIPAFAKRIRDVRNILTHPGSKRREPKPDEILKLSNQMQHLLTLLILKGLGKDSKSMANLVRTKHGVFYIHGET